MSVESQLQEIIDTNSMATIDGQPVDIFTAHLILTVANRLNEENKKSLLESSIHEMVAISYKILTR